MSRLRERFPPRLADPLARVRGHVDRRAGAVDETRERRKRRQEERAPFVGGGDGPTTVFATASYNPPSISSQGHDSVSLTVPGVANDGTWVCSGSFTGITGAGSWIVHGHPTGTNTAEVRIHNVTNNAHDLGAGTAAIRCWKNG